MYQDWHYMQWRPYMAYKHRYDPVPFGWNRGYQHGRIPKLGKQDIALSCFHERHGIKVRCEYWHWKYSELLSYDCRPRKTLRCWKDQRKIERQWMKHV